MNYDRVLLELLDRVSTLEEEIAMLKQAQSSVVMEGQEFYSTTTSTRDTTKYILAGRKYPKSRLVHAIVRRYMDLNPYVPSSQLLFTFDPSLQGSLGVVRKLEEVRDKYPDCEKRFFMKTEELIHTATDTCVVCSQWNIGNIGNIISRASELGMQITPVSKVAP
ncbi:MAG: hypothetical protein R3Y47_11590 [Lachnospiraceae bacterium]